MSPIDGIVLSRLVEPGQTVAATFQTPLLFTLAEDLSQMQLKVDVDEADIGRCAKARVATFTVDAYPRHAIRRARGVGAIRAEDRQGVVTYEAVLDFDNTRAVAAAGHDGHRRHRDEDADRRAAHAQRGAALQTARR